MMKKSQQIIVLVLLVIAERAHCAAHHPDEGFCGAWAFELPDGNPAWLSLSHDGTELRGELLWSVGSARRIETPVIQDGTLTFKRKLSWQPFGGATIKEVAGPFHGTLRDDLLHLTVTQITVGDNQTDPEVFTLTGHRIPPIPPVPNLSEVSFGEPIELFNGRDLTGWKLSRTGKQNGWSVKDGCLVNETPKQDFGAYGDFGNLMTEQVFTDFQLQIEYNVPEGGNSGIYLRGMYEAQVVDRDSRMQGIQGPGAIFGRLAPLANSGNPGGAWNTYVLTLVDRHITVELNGQTVIDNQPLPGCTGGCIQANDTLPGPILLQGDHTPVRYRNIVLRPVHTPTSESESVWNLERLSQPPAMKWLDETSPVRSLTYTGENFEGKATSVFAYYATPGTISGDASADKDLPAVVLVHGGGGTAFADWVWLWARRGYAAIAMDLSGHRPEAPVFKDGQLVPNLRPGRVRLPDGGPDQGHPRKFDSIGGEQDDDWPWHAVSSVIRAHSLIRSFTEVNAQKTAVTGISWGGYTTCLVASVDHRFKAAVPVYGCGFLFDGESVQRPAIDALPAELRSEWIRRYDPSSHLPDCRVPVLFVNGTNDKHYPLKSYSRSFQLIPGPKQIRIEVNMRHSHPAGWEPEEIGLFIDSQLGRGSSLPKLEMPVRQQDHAVVAYAAAVPLKSAELHFTTNNGPLVERHWKSLPAEFDDRVIRTPGIPSAATIWFVSATDQRGAMTSTDVIFPPE